MTNTSLHRVAIIFALAVLVHGASATMASRSTETPPLRNPSTASKTKDTGVAAQKNTLVASRPPMKQAEGKNDPPPPTPPRLHSPRRTCPVLFDSAYDFVFL
jgi:hypothetical protein